MSKPLVASRDGKLRITVNQAKVLLWGYDHGGRIIVGRGAGKVPAAAPVLQALIDYGFIIYAGALPKGHNGALWDLTPAGLEASLVLKCHKSNIDPNPIETPQAAPPYPAYATEPAYG